MKKLLLFLTLFASTAVFAADITVVSREAGSGTRSAFIELTGVEAKVGDIKKDQTSLEAIVASKTDIVISTVEGDTNAIGYISTGSLSNRVKAVKIEGVSPDSANIKSGAYKLARPFNLAFVKLGKGGEDFVNFIESSAGQAVIAKNYIALKDAPQKFSSSKVKGKLVIAGSSSVTPVMEKLQEAYNAINPALDIEIQMSDSSTGITSAINGTCEIGMVSRELKPQELAKLKSLTIAIDGIAVIVNNKNKTGDMTLVEIRDIFTGKKSKW